MPSVDAAALAALGGTIVQPAYFGFIDFVGAPFRATTFGADVTFAATGDAELDGTYSAVDPRFVEVSDVANGEGGSDTVTVTLSGIASIDSATLALIADRSKWYLRTLRLWMRVHDESGATAGAIIPYKTGWMVDARIVPHPESQTIEIRAETYMALLRSASNRTYLDQALHDPDDLSAGATIGAANGARTGPAAAIGIGRNSGSAGNRDGSFPWLSQVNEL